jgi:hypothetical protein
MYLAAAAFSLAACSATSDKGLRDMSASPDGMRSPDMPGPPGSDFATTPDLGTVADFAPHGDLATPPDLWGTVSAGLIGVSSFSSSAGISSAMEAFFWPTPYFTSPTCTYATSGSCVLSTCGLVKPPDGGYGGFVSAGTLTLTGGAKTVTITPNPDGTYPPWSDTTAMLFTGGETLTLSASGATVSAFSTSLTAPAQILVSTPALPAPGSKLAVARSADFPMSWIGGGTGNAQAILSAITSTNRGDIVCTVPASKGALTIPASLLMQLPASPTTTAIDVISTSRVQTTVGGYALTFTANSIAVGSTTGLFFVDVQLN